MQLETKINGPVAVIGDIHGQTDKLQSILDQLRERPDFQERWIVFIGDFVDRGDDTRGSISTFLELCEEHPKTTAIAGNHEFAMGAALGWFPVQPDAHWAMRWIQHYDSDKTFHSYGVEHGDIETLQRTIPASHRDLIKNLPWVVEHPRFLFVHAGLDRNTPFPVQLRILQQRDFTLNRPQWLCSKTFVDTDPPDDCPVPVVSGHVRVAGVQMRPKRILIDTTGGIGGELSCVLLPERKVLSSGGPVLASAAGESKGWWKLWG
jgi:serine/threonine protein phosphatase 1